MRARTGNAAIGLLFGLLFGLLLAVSPARAAQSASEAAVAPTPEAASEPAPAPPAFELRGYRGARGLAPENTLAGIDQALAVGVTTLALDVVVTADDVLVAYAEPLLVPEITRDPSGTYVEERLPVRGLTLEELQRFDVGRIRPGTEYARAYAEQITRDRARIPTLQAAFDRVVELEAHHVRFALDIRIRPDRPDLAPEPKDLAALVAALVRENGLEERVVVESYDWRLLDALAEIAPEIARGCRTAEIAFDTLRAGEPGPSAWLNGRDIDDFGGSAARAAADAGCVVWAPDHRDLDAEALEEARAHGLKVVPGLVNETAEMRRLLGLGVDGLTTDFPNRLRALLVERGLPAPPQVRIPTR